MHPTAEWHITLKAPGATAAAMRLRIPPLARTPLVLTAREGGGRVACASREALERGVLPGMSVARARGLCHRTVVLEYSQTAVSTATAFLAKALACSVQAVSPDLFSVVPFEGHDVDQVVNQIRVYCTDGLNVPSSLKAASSLLWARVAMEYGERCPDIIPQGHEAFLLADVPLSALPWLPAPGITVFGRQWSVFTLGDLAAVPPPLIQRLLGREAVELARLGAQSEPAGVQPFRAAVPLSPATNSNHAVRRALLTGIDCAWSHLRQITQAARSIEVALHGSDGRMVKRQAVLHPEPEDPVNLGRAAVDLLRRLIMRHAVRTVVVRVWPGCSAGRQLSLFPLFSSAKSEQLGHALTELSVRFGENTVVRAAALLPSAA